MSEIDLGKYTIEQVQAFWDQMLIRNPIDGGKRGEPHVIFSLRDVRFAIKSDSCKGVAPYRAPSPLPVLPPHILGVTSLRGRPISVTDLAVFFGLPPSSGIFSKRGHLLIIQSDGEETALLVDWVDRLDDIDLSELRKPPPKRQGFRTGLVAGEVDHGGAPLLVINAARCIKAAETP